MKSKSKKAFNKNVESEMHAGKPQDQSLAIAYGIQKQAKKKKKMALGGAVEEESHSKPIYNRNPGTPAKKPDDSRLPESDYMSKNWSEGSAPARKPDDQRLPESETMSGSMKEPEDHQMLASYHEEQANMHRMMAAGGMVEGAEDDNEPSVPMAKSDDERPSESEYMSSHFSKGGIADAIMKKRKPKMMADGGMVDIQENGEEEDANAFDDLNEEAYMKELYDDSQLDDQPEDSNLKGHDLPDEDSHDMVSQIRKKMRMKRSMD